MNVDKEIVDLWEHITKVQEQVNVWMTASMKIDQDQRASIEGLIMIIKDLQERVKELENKPAIRKTPLN